MSTSPVASPMEHRAATAAAKAQLTRRTVIWAVVVGAMAVAIGVGVQHEGRTGLLTRDPLALADLPWYGGILSNLGVAIWIAGAAIAAFSAFVARASAPGAATYLAWFAGLTLVLALDDLLQLHEQLQTVSRFGERLVVAALGIALVAIVFAYRRVVARRQPILLGVALLCFALSIGADWLEAGFVYEDGTKFVGIVAWSLWLGLAAWDELEARLARPQVPSP